MKVSIAFDGAAMLAQKLDASGQRLAILVRRGQDLEKYKVTYSHAAFVAKEGQSWVVYHSLNKCASSTAGLYAQGLAEFLVDDLVSQDVAVVFPKPWLQSRLLEILATKDEMFRMHSSRYSAVAYPFSTRYQNSNGWILETFAKAASNILLTTRAEAQHWLAREGYQGDIITLRPVTRLGARLFTMNVAFDDQPNDLRWKDRVMVSTGDAVLRFVAKFGMDEPDCLHADFGPSVCLLKLASLQ